MTSIDEQSKDIALGVNNSMECKDGSDALEDINGAGDQGMMFGYACNETPELMPLPISLAHKLALQLTNIRKSGKLKYLRPDGKTQVTIEYADGKPIRVDTIVISTQHSPDIEMSQLREDIVSNVIFPIVPNYLIDNETKIHINPTGRFVTGGPHGDSGLTGRKIIVAFRHEPGFITG